MSAFLVSKKHIDALVFARTLNKMRGGRIDDMPDDDLGRMLWRENMLSIAARYADQPLDAKSKKTLAAYRFDHVGIAQRVPSDPVTLIKLVHCYRYQSCEHDGWLASKTATFCDWLESMLTHQLPGYDAAPWGIP